MNKEEVEKLIKDYAEMHEKLQKVIKQFEAVETEEESKEWKPEINESYYFVIQDEVGDYYIKDYEYDDDGYDEKIMKAYKIFKTRAEAQEYADYLKAIADRTYKFSKEEISNTNIKKYFICYWGNDDKLQVEHNTYSNGFTKFKFKTYEEAQAFLDEFGSMILKYEM